MSTIGTCETRLKLLDSLPRVPEVPQYLDSLPRWLDSLPRFPVVTNLAMI